LMEEADKPGRSGAAPGDAGSSSGASPSAGPSAPTAVSKDPRALARALQAELKRVAKKMLVLEYDEHGEGSVE